MSEWVVTKEKIVEPVPPDTEAELRKTLPGNGAVVLEYRGGGDHVGIIIATLRVAGRPIYTQHYFPGPLTRNALLCVADSYASKVCTEYLRASEENIRESEDRLRRATKRLDMARGFVHACEAAEQDKDE